MGKGTYVTGNLHRISGQIAEAAAKRGGAGAPGADAEAQPDMPAEGSTAGESVQAEAPVRSPEFAAALQRRSEEYLRLRRDVMARLASHLSSIPAEAEIIGKRYEELSAAVEKLQELLNMLESLGEPQVGDGDYSARLAESCRSVENARLEMIRVTARVEKSGSASLGQQESRGQIRDSLIPELNSLGFTQLLKFGLFLTLPIAASIIFGGLIIAFSIYAAMRLGG